jgi:hypothetical protein
MLQKKPNLELAQAMIDSQPPALIYKPHPSRKNVLQSFNPTYTLNPDGSRVIVLGKPLGNFRLVTGDEKFDVKIFSAEHKQLMGYKRY